MPKVIITYTAEIQIRHKKPSKSAFHHKAYLPLHSELLFHHAVFGTPEFSRYEPEFSMQVPTVISKIQKNDFFNTHFVEIFSCNSFDLMTVKINGLPMARPVTYNFDLVKLF